MVSWLVGCFGFNGPLRQYFSLYRAVSQREEERGERIDESKNVQTTPTRTYCKCSRPLPYCNPNCRTPRHWKFTQHHCTTRPSPLPPDGQRVSGGTSIIVKSNVPHSRFDLNTNLQAVAVNVTLSKKVTICSIYLPASDTLSKNSLVNLIDQLPHPFMLVGDFNGHSKVWGCSDTNDRGEIIEDIIAENDLCLLNEKQPTYLHPPTGNYYAIDLSLCHPNIYLDFDWSVCDDLDGSDHFPILIKETDPSDDEQHCRWNLKKANWETFTT